MQPRAGRAATVFAEADAEVSARLWFDWFLAQPHPMIGRKGHVCPFVEPASRAGSLRVELRRLDVADLPPAAQQRAVREEVEALERRFGETEWGYRNRTLHALVFVYPALRPESWPLLDGQQARAKAGLADRGLMLGQFHPDCRVPAARNPRFPVSSAPVPMLAMRHMAFHDVLFLDQDPRTFAAYRRRYGSRYAAPDRVDPLFAERYAAAARRHAAGDTPGAAPRPPTEETGA